MTWAEGHLSKWLAAGGLAVFVVFVFVVLYRLQRQIEPEGRDIDNDEWLRKGGD